MSTTDISCLCGATHLRLNDQPVAQFYCHCDDCQATHGASYVGLAVFPSHAVEVLQGATVTWTYKTLPRERCPTCGTFLIAEVPDSDLTGVKANLLPPRMFTPAFHIHCQHAVLPIVDDLPHYRSLPADFGGSDDVVTW
ncbi:MAG: GFA family protein [Natronospirillum sp.]